MVFKFLLAHCLAARFFCVSCPPQSGPNIPGWLTQRCLMSLVWITLTLTLTAHVDIQAILVEMNRKQQICPFFRVLRQVRLCVTGKRFCDTLSNKHGTCAPTGTIHSSTTRQDDQSEFSVASHRYYRRHSRSVSFQPGTRLDSHGWNGLSQDRRCFDSTTQP
jgi:hypothetical protein